MSCVVVVPVVFPLVSGVLSGLAAAAAVAAATGLGLTLNTDGSNESTTAKNSVDLCLNNAAEAVAGASVGQKMHFAEDGVAVEFSVDENGRALVHASGYKSEEELRELGETLAKRIVQQYAYHRVVTEMRERNMNLVEEEVEEDGTVRMLVRVHHG
jgi:hypothetical protein